MLPGKKYTPEELVHIVWNRKWLIVTPLLLVSGLTFAVSQRLPKTYRSETVILVVPQRVPESYVRSTVTTRIEDRLNSISSQILSRSRLEGIIREFNLYAEQREIQVLEGVVDQMRNAIDVKVERGDAFRVSYISADPKTAQKVTERLASLFIQESLRDREKQAEGTNEFLDSQLKEAKERLVEHEHKLEDYKRRFSGELPSQVQANLQAIQNTQLQLQALAESMNRDRDRRLVLERQLADFEAPLGAVIALPDGSHAGVPVSTAQQLDDASAELKRLELRYKPEHPDIGLAKRRVRELEAKLEGERKLKPSETATARPPSVAEVLRQNKLRELKTELHNIDVQLQRSADQERQLKATTARYQSKVDVVPTREVEMTELTRDYATLQSTYTSLLGKRQESTIAVNLERNKVGEQFKLLDPARVPERPYSPDLMRINGVGFAVGLAIGLGLVALLEYLDSSFKTEEDIVRVLQLQVLALVPVLTSASERRRQVQWRLAVTLAALLVLASSAAVALWTFRAV